MRRFERGPKTRESHDRAAACALLVAGRGEKTPAEQPLTALFE